MEIRDDRDISDEMIRDRLYDELAARNEEIAALTKQRDEAETAISRYEDTINERDRENAALKAVLGMVKDYVDVNGAGFAGRPLLDLNALLADIPAPLAVVETKTLPGVRCLRDDPVPCVQVEIDMPQREFGEILTVVVLPKGDER